MYIVRKNLLVAAFVATGIFFAKAQKAPEKSWNSARILHEIEKVKHVGRVLYIAAHPDDENTQLIAYLANVKGIDVAYMSLTRGDGGQDLLGPEVRDELGVIRTQELLMARATDGGQQFFSRANDFGFSKTAKETLHIWDSTEVLSDIVWEIRRFKPDIIITRFSPTYTKTHGHHQASAILAQVAFDDAANPDKFPDQLKYVSTWQAKSLFWNTSYFFFQDKSNKFDTTGLYHSNIGVYMPLLGEWTGEMAAESRSMHKSQGMGSSLRRGDNVEYFVSLKGEKPVGKDIFSDYDWGWDTIKGCKDVPAMIDRCEKELTDSDRAACFEDLGKLYYCLKPHADNYLVAAKLNQLEDIVLQCAGIYNEAISTQKFLTPGDSINVSFSAITPYLPNVALSGKLLVDNRVVAKNTYPTPLIKDETNTFPLKGIIPDSTNITGPYWLEDEHTVGMYTVEDRLLRGLPQNPAQVKVRVRYSIRWGVSDSTTPRSIRIEKDIPVFYKYTDPLKGETYSLARVVPPVVVIPQEHLLVFADNKPKEIHLKVKSFKKGKATINLRTPESWYINDNTLFNSAHCCDGVGQKLKKDLILKGDGTEQTLTFYVKPPTFANSGEIYISIDVDGHTYNRSIEDINYEHIAEQVLLPKSQIKVVRMDVTTHPKLIGYINGAGDDVPASLKEMGYKVEIISPEQLATANLNKYDAIIAGIRAYNTVDRLKYDNARFMEYVKNGGNYIVQYNNNFRLVTDSIGPYYLHPANVRTTEEDCKITFLNPNNAALNTPNKITEKDFEGWVQERGLYYPDKWDTTHYIPLLQMNDAGEAPTKSALLIAKYGKGNFVYTGLVFFRELPAGVPGAYRLLANLIELGKHDK